MNRPTRFKQDAAIVMAIIIVILLLWRLTSHPKGFGGMGAWAGTNIFGPATLSLISGSESGEPASNGGLTTVSNEVAPIKTNTPTAPSSPPPVNEAPPGSRQTLSTNLLNSNGPVTVIAVTPADLVETPPGVTSASNVSEAASIERRLGEVSAKGGDIQISLSWNNYNDLDLHCIDPTGEEIWFSHPRSNRTGGELDVDKNAHPPFTTAPVENIYWPIGAARPGLYKIFVVFYSPRNGLDPNLPTAFTVRTVVRDWKTYFFKSVISYTGHQEPKPICILRYDPANPDPARRFGFVQ
jgi:hypothetical protein